MSVRLLTSLTAVWLATTMSSGACRTPNAPPSPEAATVRQQLERQYELNRQAFLKEDLDAIMALRTDDFHTVGPEPPPGGSCGGWTVSAIGDGWWTGKRSSGSRQQFSDRRT